MSTMRDDEMLDPTLQRVIAALREPVAPSAGLSARVLRAARRPRWRRAADWMVEPHAVRVSPIGMPCQG